MGLDTYVHSITVYTEIFARRKFSPILPMHAVGKNMNFAHVIMSTRAYAHTNNLRVPPTTSWKVICVIGEIKFSEIFVPIYKV